MTIQEACNTWKNKCFKGLKCVYGGIEGGSGYLGFGSCRSENHPNVRYGCECCPKNCKDYIEDTESKIFTTFLMEYRSSPSYYNKKYNIDKNDKFYFAE